MGVLIIETTWFTLTQLGFSVKMSDWTNRGRQKDKTTADIGRDTHNSFTVFIGRYRVAHKEGHQKKKTCTYKTIVWFTANIFRGLDHFSRGQDSWMLGTFTRWAEGSWKLWGTFTSVGADIFPTTYLIYDPFSYKFSILTVHVLCIMILVAFQNTQYISFNVLWEFLKLANILLVTFRWR